MNQPITSNTSDDQRDDYDSQKSARRPNRRVLLVVIALVLVTALIFALFLMNRNDSRSPAASMDTRSTNSDQPSPGTANSNPAQPAVTGTVITTGESEFGTMLFNEKRQAIYIWELENSSKVECYGGCAEAWPPVLTDGNPQATGEVNSDLLGTTKRSDGSTQVTYNGHPLYYYAHEGAGEVKCHNVATHGGLWWVIRPNGNRAD